jgi:hypothetical protein
MPASSAMRLQFLRQWYKDEGHSPHTWAAGSTNLRDWKVVGPIVTGRGHEGPNVFLWRGSWWMMRPRRRVGAGRRGLYLLPRRSSIQIARLDIMVGNLICDRNAEFPFSLKRGVDNWMRV